MCSIRRQSTTPSAVSFLCFICDVLICGSEPVDHIENSLLAQCTYSHVYHNSSQGGWIDRPILFSRFVRNGRNSKRFIVYTTASFMTVWISSRVSATNHKSNYCGIQMKTTRVQFSWCVSAHIHAHTCTRAVFSSTLWCYFCYSRIIALLLKMVKNWNTHRWDIVILIHLNLFMQIKIQAKPERVTGKERQRKRRKGITR